MSRVVRTASVIAASAAACGVLALSAGCSGGSSSTAASPAPTPAATGTRTGGQRVPGVSGLIAAVEGSTMQVQSQTKQTAVTWNASTAFSRVATGAPADITVGSCVTVRPADGAGNATDTAGPVNAASVVVLSLGDGTSLNGCSVGDGRTGAGGFGPGGGPGGPPSGAPGGGAGAPTGRPDGAGRALRAVFGQVTAVNPQGFTVASTRFGGDGSTGAAPSTEPVSIVVSAQTTVTVTRAGTAADATVGRCANAQGSTDQTGAMTATRVTITDAVQGSCVVGGFGPGGGGRPTGTSNG